AARMPFPSATRACAVSCSSLFGMEISLCRFLPGLGFHYGRATIAEAAGVAQLVEHWLPKPRVAGSSPVSRFAIVEQKAPFPGLFWPVGRAAGLAGGRARLTERVCAVARPRPTTR